jgi:hypothetical protein
MRQTVTPLAREAITPKIDLPILYTFKKSMPLLKRRLRGASPIFSGNIRRAHYIARVSKLSILRRTVSN